MVTRRTAIRLALMAGGMGLGAGSLVGRAIAATLPADGYGARPPEFLTTALFRSAPVDGRSDNTNDLRRAIQTASEQGKGLRVLKGDYRVSVSYRGVSLPIPSNSWIEFEGGAKITALPHDADTYAILGVRDAQDVTIIDAFVDGNKAENAAPGGENGICIGVNGSTNVTLIRPRTIGAWGDGIFVGASYVGGKQFSENVKISKPYATACRRQGMSIISAVNLTVDDALWEGIKGTWPQRGLDIEPDPGESHVGYELRDIVINNPRTRNCWGGGINISLKGLAHAANVRGASAKDVSITINGHVDEDCGHGEASFSINPLDLTNSVPVTGFIRINNPQWLRAGVNGMLVRDYDAHGPTITVVRPLVVDNNQSGQQNGKSSAAFAVYSQTGKAGYPIGGVTIIQPTVRISAGRPKSSAYFFDRDAGVRVVEPQHLSGVLS